MLQQNALSIQALRRQRNEVVKRLFDDAALNCCAIADLTWHDALTLKTSVRLRRLIRALHRAERQRGFGNLGSHVVRFRGLSSDPVVRANAVVRLLSASRNESPSRERTVF